MKSHDFTQIICMNKSHILPRLTGISSRKGTLNIGTKGIRVQQMNYFFRFYSKPLPRYPVCKQTKSEGGIGVALFRIARNFNIKKGSGSIRFTDVKLSMHMFLDDLPGHMQTNSGPL